MSQFLLLLIVTVEIPLDCNKLIVTLGVSINYVYGFSFLLLKTE